METGCGAIPHYLALFGETLPHKVVAVVTGSDLSRITPRLRLPAIKKKKRRKVYDGMGRCGPDTDLPRGRAQDSQSLAGIITQAFSKRLWLGHLQLLYRLV